jgi:hypothetical protein
MNAVQWSGFFAKFPGIATILDNLYAFVSIAGQDPGF